MQQASHPISHPLLYSTWDGIIFIFQSTIIPFDEKKDTSKYFLNEETYLTSQIFENADFLGCKIRVIISCIKGSKDFCGCGGEGNWCNYSLQDPINELNFLPTKSKHHHPQTRPKNFPSWKLVVRIKSTHFPLSTFSAKYVSVKTSYFEHKQQTLIYWKEAPINKPWSLINPKGALPC